MSLRIFAIIIPLIVEVATAVVSARPAIIASREQSAIMIDDFAASVPHTLKDTSCKPQCLAKFGFSQFEGCRHEGEKGGVPTATIDGKTCFQVSLEGARSVKIDGCKGWNLDISPHNQDGAGPDDNHMKVYKEKDPATSGGSWKWHNCKDPGAAPKIVQDETGQHVCGYDQSFDDYGCDVSGWS